MPVDYEEHFSKGVVALGNLARYEDGARVTTDQIRALAFTFFLHRNASDDARSIGTHFPPPQINLGNPCTDFSYEL